MFQARTRRLALCLLLSAFALGSVTRVDAEQIVFGSGRWISVKNYRVDGDVITVTLESGGQATFSTAVVAEIRPDELPLDAAPESDLPPAAPTGPVVVGHGPLDARPFAALIESVSLEHGVDPELVHAVVLAESNYEVRARSRVGARGLMQVMPETARNFGITNLYDPAHNIEAGVQYLKFLLARFDLPRALAAYNAGPTAVRRYGGVPPFAETQTYVRKVFDSYEKFTASVRGPRR